MTVQKIKELLDAQVLCGESLLEREVHTACGSDMMSDVLAFVKEQAVLLTGLVNPQVIRTAEMMDMQCIVFVRGKQPDEDMKALAAERGMAGASAPPRCSGTRAGCLCPAPGRCAWRWPRPPRPASSGLCPRPRRRRICS